MKFMVGTAVAAGTLTIIGLASAQVRPPRPRVPGLQVQCLHEESETDAERQRRERALALVHLTDRLVQMARQFPAVRPPEPYPSWDQLAGGGARLGRMDGGPMGRLAREAAWGTGEPLPGWRAHYVADINGYSLSLTDSRDACGWTYYGDERGSVGHGYLLDARGGVVPVDSQ
jgi:hypothetical protein